MGRQHRSFLEFCAWVIHRLELHVYVNKEIKNSFENGQVQGQKISEKAGSVTNFIRLGLEN